MNPLIQQQKLIEWCWVPDSASDSNNTYPEFQLFKSSYAAGKALACTLEPVYRHLSASFPCFPEHQVFTWLHKKCFWNQCTSSHFGQEVLHAVVFNKAYSKCGAIFSQIVLNPVLKSSECFALEYSGKHDDWFTVLILYGLSVCR